MRSIDITPTIRRKMSEEFADERYRQKTLDAGKRYRIGEPGFGCICWEGAHYEDWERRTGRYKPLTAPEN
jgi:hypothetical protein